MKKFRELLVGNKGLSIAHYIALLGMLGLTSTSTYQEVMLAIRNRPVIRQHNQEQAQAQDNFDNALLDYIGHMTEAEFNDFSVALSRIQNATRDTFVSFRYEDWMEELIASDQVTSREEMGLRERASNGTIRRIGSNATEYMHGTDEGRFSTHWTGTNLDSARSQMQTLIEDIVNTATIGDPNMSLEEFVGMRLVELQAVEITSPDVEQHASPLLITVNTILALLAAAGIYTMADISLQADKIRKKEKAAEDERLQRLMDTTLETFSGKTPAEVEAMIAKYMEEHEPH